MKNFSIVRKLDDFREIVNHAIHDFEELHDHPYGRITVFEVEVDHDYDFLDITVTAQHDDGKLPNFLAPTASRIRTMIGKSLSLRKVPKIRFRSQKGESPDAVLSILSELEKKYDLHE